MQAEKGICERYIKPYLFHNYKDLMLKVFIDPDFIQWHKQLEFWGYGAVYTIHDLDLALCMENDIDSDATRAECAEFMEKIADAFRQAACSIPLLIMVVTFITLTKLGQCADNPFGSDADDIDLAFCATVDEVG